MFVGGGTFSLCVRGGRLALNGVHIICVAFCGVAAKGCCCGVSVSFCLHLWARGGGGGGFTIGCNETVAFCLFVVKGWS